ncbi:hypothetical protein RND81_01G177600 [Saponaria officinalis]|uniref:Uncharacterized protein n=1 Tax=Saponaria officinalis TaxID=3572 RepID=A0AAW1NGW0_SAPOF
MKSSKEFQPSVEDTPKRQRSRLFFDLVMAFFMRLFALLYSATSKLSGGTARLISNFPRDIPNVILGSKVKEECTASVGLQSTDADLLSFILRRLAEHEEKMNTLQTKAMQMPPEKDELLNAAIYRMDAIEAELSSTKKALHEALMRQEDVLAYMDAQAAAKYSVSV